MNAGGGARFAVGIDLGTTHTVVAFAALEGDEPPRIFPIPQWVGRSERQALPLLASALYAPLEGEMPEAGAGAAETEGPRETGARSAAWVVGEHARRRGSEVPGRVVHSAKSWLSHTGVDRAAPILPWGAPPEGRDFELLSPVEASARVLRHVREAWDQAHPGAPLSAQRIVLTVPASFDEAARELTVRAAEEAGLPVRLLEEPQAAFYAWLEAKSDDHLRDLVAAHGGPLDAVVCDVGGGTTDLSLLRIAHEQGAPPSIERIAVGRHLLLGGDNMDLALAHACEPALLKGREEAHLDARRFGQLALACRAAKERLLAEDAPAEAPIAVADQGSRLVGSTLRTTLRAEDARRVVLEGFFPETARRIAPAERGRSGLVAFGLPYERDAAITRHLARFCDRHLGDAPGPSAVLLNGGVFLARAIEERLLAVVQSWSEGPVLHLSNPEPELAVALGAVSFARATLGRARRIRSGLGRGYYVAVEGADRTRALVCVVPRGAVEGEVHVAASRPLSLVVGAPARFELFASEHPLGHAAGDVVPLDDERFEALPPLAVSFARGDARGTAETPVVLEGELSSVGTLNLACVALAPDANGHRARFRLAFQIRPGDEPPRVAPSPSAPPGATSARRLEEASRAVERIFGKTKAEVAPREVKDLQRDLERALGERGQWPTAVNRALFDELFKGHRGRRRSADHERVFWQLAGYCLRPGFGDPGDATRVAAFAALFQDKLAFPAEARGWQAFWIAWRRVAGGLSGVAQTALRDATDPFLAPKELRKKRPGSIRPEALDEMLEMASYLERVAAERRGELGEWLVERTFTDRDPRLWLAVGRLGARVPAYASAHHVVAPPTVERWIDFLLREKWDKVPVAAGVAVELARMTGDRARDVRDAVRADVERRLARLGARAEWVAAVREVVPLAEQERAAAFGDGLPVGLRLTDAPGSMTPPERSADAQGAAGQAPASAEGETEERR